MVFQYHPDRNPDDQGAAEKFKQILEAYGILSDSDRRAIYDEATRSVFEEEKPDEEDAESEGQFGNGIGSGFKFSNNFKTQAASEPKCPGCSVVGVEHVVARKGGAGASKGKQFILSPFNVIFCSECGHVYGVTGASS